MAEKKTKDESHAEPADNAAAPISDAELDARTDPQGGDEPRDLEAELAAERDRSLRLKAEVQNQINRHSRQLAEERRYAALPVVKDLLPVLDNVDRAIEAAEKSQESAGLLEGFRLVRQQLAAVLKHHQCEPIEATGEPFDPAFHEAILQQPSAEHPAGVVTQTVQTGYRMHDRVVRASQVIVSSGEPEQE